MNVSYGHDAMHNKQHFARCLSLSLSALFDPETYILIQNRHPYTGNPNSETSGDSNSAFLHPGDVLAHSNACRDHHQWSCKGGMVWDPTLVPAWWWAVQVSLLTLNL